MSGPRRRSSTFPLLLVLFAFAILFAILKWNVREQPVTFTPMGSAAPELDAGAQAAPAPLPPVQLHPPAAPVKPQLTAAGPPAAPEDVESHCGGIGAFGVCDGNVAKACVANAVYTVDCAAHSLRCVVTTEGAQCLPQDPAGCSGTEGPRCVGNRLRSCVDGIWQEIDCAKRGSLCAQTPQGARCGVANVTLPKRATEEICDGHDNDLDGRVDEQGVCSDVPLVAFVPAGYTPENLEARMQTELAILNHVYAPTVFRWEKTDTASEAYRFFSPKRLRQASAELAHNELPEFYIAVLYVEDLLMSPPKGGVSTLPNNHCGGIRVSDRASPPDGLIVLPEGRQPETLAHEMGHYLGLCHTHQALDSIAVASSDAPVCKETGDGICDTPFDPGPTQCVREQVCDIVCPSDGARPDPMNIMSYYIGCRQELTPDQLAEAQRNLSLRRGWFRCLDATSCACTPGVANQCPDEMSCQPRGDVNATWSCELDGPALPGSLCEDTSQCGLGSFCLQARTANRSTARCVRPCQLGDDCSCIDVGLRFRICNEDLPEAHATGTHGG